DSALDDPAGADAHVVDHERRRSDTPTRTADKSSRDVSRPWRREAPSVDARELEAREHIRDTVTRYAHCVDGGRFDELVELFAPDGVLEVEGEPAHRGRDAIRAFVTGTGRDLAAGTGAPRIRHHVSNVLI